MGNRPRFRMYLLCHLALLTGAVAHSQTQTQALGGGGGGGFDIQCPRYAYLAGFRVYIGHDMDAISPVCAALGESGARGPLSPMSAHPFAGNTTRDVRELVCPDATRAPFVKRLEVHAEGSDTYIVNGIRFWCGPANGAETAGSYHAHGPNAPRTAVRSVFAGSNTLPSRGNVACQQGQAPAGIHGRAGLFVDALGLVCRDIELQPIGTVAIAGQSAQPSAARAAASEVQTGSRRSRTQIGGVATPPANNTAISARQGPTLIEPARGAGPAPALAAANRLICRGGPTLNIETIFLTQGTSPPAVLRLSFGTINQPARGDAGGLVPGSCGFVDRPWTSGDPPGLVLESSDRDEVLKLAAHLREPGNYWNFNVEKGAYGYFRVLGHSPLDQGQAAARVDCRPRRSGVVDSPRDLDSRVERIRCEQQNLDNARQQQLARQLDDVITWIEGQTGVKSKR